MKQPVFKFQPKQLSLQQLVFLGILVALNIVLQRLSLGPVTLKVGLGFLGSALLGYFYGSIWGSLGALVSDLASSALFGQEGGFFIGFTVSAMLAVIIYGCFLASRNLQIWRVVVATLLVSLVVNLGLNTLWIHLLYGVNLQVAFWQRLPKELLAPWLQIVITWTVLRALARVKTESWFQRK